MNKRYRLSLMGLSLIVLLVVGYWVNHNFQFIVNDF